MVRALPADDIGIVGDHQAMGDLSDERLELMPPVVSSPRGLSTFTPL